MSPHLLFEPSLDLDDAIEAEGGNRNVRIWDNVFDRVNVAIANAATTVGPLYVRRNVGQRMGGMYDRDAGARGPRGPSNDAKANCGRAYYFHNTAPDAGAGIADDVGRAYNSVARNNAWPKSQVNPTDGPFDLGTNRVERIPNFNDRYARPESGAHQSGAPPMRSASKRIEPVSQRIDAVAEHDRLGFGRGCTSRTPPWTSF